MGPWAGKSALDAVELMDAGWNFRREHLDPSQRSHSVITNGGRQPNIVPDEAAVGYYFRNPTSKGVQEMSAIADRIADGGIDDRHHLQPAHPRFGMPNHGNKALAEDMDKTSRRSASRTGAPTTRPMPRRSRRRSAKGKSGCRPNRSRSPEPSRCRGCTRSVPSLA